MGASWYEFELIKHPATDLQGNPNIDGLKENQIIPGWTEYPDTVKDKSYDKIEWHEKGNTLLIKINGALKSQDATKYKGKQLTNQEAKDLKKNKFKIKPKSGVT